MLLKLLILFLLFKICISIDTISINQSLTDGHVLLSQESNFALGFFSPGSSRYMYLGIWYHKLPGNTVVWVANRDNPINDSSGSLSISPDGNLVIYTRHDNKFPIWSTNVSVRETGGCVAHLLDSGNLVLVHNETKRIVWQSFDHPTDTFLPGMRLGLDRKNGLEKLLTSWRSPDDPRIGEYSVKMNPTGSPQLFVYKGGLTPKWRSHPWPWNIAMLEPIPKYLYRYTLVNTEDEVYYTDIIDDKSVITRSVIDNSGLLHRLIWDNASRKWKQCWSSGKENYGHCGAHAVFNGNNITGFECTCLPGYKPKSLEDWNLRDGSAGCVMKQKHSICRNNEEGFLRVEHVKIPDTSIAVLMNRSLSHEECEQQCLRNCSCKAFAGVVIDRKEVGCLMWHGELMDIREQTEGQDMYVRVQATELAENDRKKGGFLKRNGIVIIPILSAVLNVLLLIKFANFWIRKRKKRKVIKKWTERLLSRLAADELVESAQSSDVPLFDLRTITAATHNFITANKLGQGGFGSVYKGLLHDGRVVAVKRLSQSSGQGIEEFSNEVLLLSGLQHRNLVKLLGCCIQGEERLLIYEYLPNKSLDHFMFDETRRLVLDWRKRFDIIVGLARGILYLHHDSRLRIVHRDLKTSNVLLDVDMNPKISDFGMARIFKGNEVQVKTNRVVGTYGYMAPEYVIFGKFSTKSDVFSFGVILLEIITGKKCNTSFTEDASVNLIGHVWELWKEDRAVDIIDRQLKNNSPPTNQVFRCLQIGLLCVQEYAKDRPTMPNVALMLNSETTLPVPKQPAFTFRRATNVITPSSPISGICSVNELTITKFEAR